MSMNWCVQINFSFICKCKVQKCDAYVPTSLTICSITILRVCRNAPVYIYDVNAMAVDKYMNTDKRIYDIILFRH